MPSYNLATDEVLVEPAGTYRNLQETDDHKFHSDTKPKRGGWTFNIAVIVIILLVGLIAITLAFGISLTSRDVTNNKESANAEGSQAAQVMEVSGVNITLYPVSCLDAFKKGHISSGLVMLQPSFMTNPFETYCDMNSVGGGWTLIASIHEGNIDSDCSSDDFWSSTSIYSSSKDSHYENWLNMKTFGDINAATSEDFKCPAYYNVKASDMMIWHVPNNVRLSDIDKEAFFKYYTDSHFLSNYGSSLQTLYTQHAPFEKAYPKNMVGDLSECIVNTNWTYSGKNYYWSSYSSSPVSTPDELSYADKVYIQVNDDSMIQLTNTTPNQVHNQVQIMINDSSLPFTSLAFIDNSDKSIQTFTMKVFRNDSKRTYDSYLGYNSYSGLVFRLNHLCSDNTCAIMFIATSSQDWNSLTPTYNFDGSEDGIFHLNLTANIRQVLVGYIVIRRLYATTYENALETVFDRAMSCFGTQTKIDLKNFPAITTPAKFLKGDMSGYTQGVTPGHIQFRQYDALGYPYALCPGIRVNNGSSTEHHCVGTAQIDYDTRHKCGDFAAWDKLAEHLAQRPASAKHTITNDLSSTLLLFVR